MVIDGGRIKYAWQKKLYLRFGMRSIKTRLAVSFIFIIIITVILLEALIINVVKQNYYKNLENNLYNHIKTSADLYYRYFSDSTLYDNVLNNVDTFWKQVPAQVEILDTYGEVLMDSIGIIPENASKMPDVKAALEGNTGKWIGKVDYDDDLVMAVSYPLKSREGNVGILRFITSLREVNKDIMRVSLIFVWIGIIAVFVSGIISIAISNTIISPLKEITFAAKKMASGNFTARPVKRHDDEIGKLADTLNYMADEIVKRDQLKNDFISSVSHELRTPLTSIKGWAVTLREGSMGDVELLYDGLEIIEKESDRLTVMVEELLDFSKFVSGKITMIKEQVDVEELVKQLKIQLSPRAERENINFEVNIEGEIPPLITDKNRLKQVFINILDNSFKFTPSGGKVLFNVMRKGNSLVFSIKDTGCGISSEELPHVKEKFFKGKNSNSSNGIGLSICDEIIKLMGGTFDITSELGKGTEVIVTLSLNNGGEV